MKWLRFTHAGEAGFGRLENSEVHVHQGDMFNEPSPTGQVLALDAISLLPPCRPSKIMALWNNFRAAAARNNWAEPAEPLYFLKAANTWSAHLAPVQRPRCYGARMIYEAELGVVIGKRGRDIPLQDAASHVFGYTCVNDVTALELLRADTSFEQWTRAKGFDGFTPFGPWIETGVDLAAMHVKALVNGRERQNYPVADMFFSPLALVSLLSRDVTLEAGDIISCGTSIGAGPWQTDAVVEVVIDGVGTLSNTLKEQA